MSMAATPEWSLGSGAATHAHTGGVSAEVLRDFDAAEAIWREMTANGHVTPYQSFPFSAAYFRHVEAPAGGELALIVLRTPAASGKPVALMPLVVRRKGPFRIASFIGGKHANFNMPAFAAGAEHLTPEACRAALIAAGRSAGIDVYCLHAQPVEWQGFANPMAGLAALPSPSHGYKLGLEADGEALLKRQLSKDTRRKTRQKEQRLATMGALTYCKPTEANACRAVMDRFFALKAERFAQQGISDPFSDVAVRNFLTEGLAAERDADRFVELHTLDLNGRPIAIFGAVVEQGRFSGLFTAFDGDPDIARSSPGDILLMHMVRDCCKRALDTFDLGVGEAHYKDKICNATEPLVETFVPVSVAGRAIALACIGKQRAKGAIKTSATGKKAIGLVRALRAKR